MFPIFGDFVEFVASTVQMPGFESAAEAQLMSVHQPEFLLLLLHLVLEPADFVQAEQDAVVEHVPVVLAVPVEVDLEVFPNSIRPNSY